MNTLFTTIPILEEWDPNRVVGELKILTAALPPTTHFHFAIGYITKDKVETYKLMCISPRPNHLFKS